MAHREGGGPVEAGVPHRVGEQGEETFIPAVSGVIATAQETRRMLEASVRAPMYAGMAPQVYRPAHGGAGHWSPTVNVDVSIGGEQLDARTYSIAWDAADDHHVAQDGLNAKLHAAGRQG